MADSSSFGDEVRAVLADTQNLPQEFLDYMVQHAAQNPVPLQTVRAPAFQSTGIGDAIQGSRYVGATTTGHPTKGYFLKGDFAIAQAGQVWLCTAAGSPGTWILIAGGFSNPGLMAAKVTLSGAMHITSGDPSKVISWNQVVADTGAPTPFYNPANPTRLTAPVNGLYLPLASLNWDIWPGHGGGLFDGMGCYIFINSGGTYLLNFAYEYNTPPTGGAGAFYTLQGGHHNTLFLNAGDYVEIAAYQDSGNTVDLIDLRPAQNHYSSFSLILVATT